MDISAPVKAIRVIQGPTIPRPSLVLAGKIGEQSQEASGRFAWRLISQLSLNYLSFKRPGGNGGRRASRNLEAVYGPGRPAGDQTD